MTRSVLSGALLCAALLLTPAVSFAEKIPVGTKQDGRVKDVNYSDSDVVKVVGRYGYNTLIEFGHDELVTDLALGDTLAWEVAPSSNRNLLFLKPREDNAATNLTVVTNRRIYHFMLQALEHRKYPSASAAFGVRFHYPMEAAAAASTAAQEQRARTALQQEERPANWNFWACGAQQLRPVEVYDDGRFTYMRFPGAQEIPAIFVINSDGTESLTNGQMRGSRFVVFTTAAKFILRKGNAVACIENRSYNWYGIDTTNGSTSPSVQRVLKADPTPAPNRDTVPEAVSPATPPMGTPTLDLGNMLDQINTLQQQALPSPAQPASKDGTP